jgi:hypothetical protein
VSFAARQQVAPDASGGGGGGNGGGGGGPPPPFTPVTSYYRGAAGVYVETIPTGALHLTAEVGGPGGGGAQIKSALPGAGGSGGLAQRTFALTSANWGQTFVVTITPGGAAGVLHNENGQTTTASSIVNQSFSTAVSLIGGPGQGGFFSGAGGAGGTASGGDTNINGIAGGASSGSPGYGVGGRAIISGAGGQPWNGGDPPTAGFNGEAAFVYS